MLTFHIFNFVSKLAQNGAILVTTSAVFFHDTYYGRAGFISIWMKSSTFTFNLKVKPLRCLLIIYYLNLIYSLIDI